MATLKDYTTYREIEQQPRLWRETYEIIAKKKETIENFMQKISYRKNRRIILAGAGTSSFIGDAVAPFINSMTPYDVESIPTTDIVSSPESYLHENVPTLLVSYARSGNSPESEKTFDLVEELMDETYHIILTCNKEGRLARKGMTHDDALVIYMPEDSNDKGLAMTGSFSTMVLASLLMFDWKHIGKRKTAVHLVSRAGQTLMESDKIDTLAKMDFGKIVYLGAAAFKGLANEAELKMLELNAGNVATRSDTPLGFRHGPKSFIDKKTVVLIFLADNEYTVKYEKDLLGELEKDGMTTDVVVGPNGSIGDLNPDITIGVEMEAENLPGIYLVFPYLIVAQRLAFLKSYNKGINPDNPSPNGVINRVVKGVTLYPYKKEGS